MNPRSMKEYRETIFLRHKKRTYNPAMYGLRPGSFHTLSTYNHPKCEILVHKISPSPKSSFARQNNLKGSIFFSSLFSIRINKPVIFRTKKRYTFGSTKRGMRSTNVKCANLSWAIYAVTCHFVRGAKSPQNIAYMMLIKRTMSDGTSPLTK